MNSRALGAILFLSVLTGCPAGKPKGDLPALHPAKGKVVRGGQPVNGGSVRFETEPANPDPDIVVSSEVGSDGTFNLQTIHALSQRKGAGAPAGTYRVTYMPALGDQTAGGKMTAVELTQRSTVNEGPNELTIELGKK